MKRNGLKGTAYGLIDDLTYSNLGNRLMRVEDAISGDYETDFVNGNSGTDDYSYYADGCLQKDLNQDITDIDYDTYLNKPVLVTLGSGEWIRYTYDGAGSLIRQELSNGTVWDYLGSMILKNGVPYQIAMAEGRVIYEDSTWHNEYEYRDQVGNLRVAFTERDGRLQKTFQADYYPFGMAFNQKVFTPAPNKFTFHGHESTPDLGLRMTMMGARCYNQTIGRFLASDVLSMAAPGWTGYRLGWNQPNNVNDPMGNFEVKQTGIDTKVYPSDGYGNLSPTTAGIAYSASAFSSGGPLFQQGDPTYSGGTLPTATVTASRAGNYDQSATRYGYNGSLEDYQKEYGFEGVAYENIVNFWVQVHGAAFDNYVATQDQAEAARIAVQKMQMFALGISTAGAMGMAGLSPSLSSPRGFNFSSPVISQPLPVHGNSLSSLKPTWGYQLYSNNGFFLKNGITSEAIPQARYTKAFMADKHMRNLQLFPNRRAAWKWEYQQNLIQRGPLNRNMH